MDYCDFCLVGLRANKERVAPLVEKEEGNLSNSGGSGQEQMSAALSIHVLANEGNVGTRPANVLSFCRPTKPPKREAK